MAAVASPADQFNQGTNLVDGKGAVVGYEQFPFTLSDDGRRLLCVDDQGRLVRDDQRCTGRQRIIADHGRAHYNSIRKQVMKILLEERLRGNALIATGVTTAPAEASPRLTDGYAKLAAAVVIPASLPRHTLTAPVLHARHATGTVTTRRAHAAAAAPVIARGTAADLAATPKIQLGSAQLAADLNNTIVTNSQAEATAQAPTRRPQRALSSKKRTAPTPSVNGQAKAIFEYGTGALLVVVGALALLAAFSKRRKAKQLAREIEAQNKRDGIGTEVKITQRVQQGPNHLKDIEQDGTYKIVEAYRDDVSGKITGYGLVDEAGKTFDMPWHQVIFPTEAEAAETVPAASVQPTQEEPLELSNVLKADDLPVSAPKKPGFFARFYGRRTQDLYPHKGEEASPEKIADVHAVSDIVRGLNAKAAAESATVQTAAPLDQAEVEPAPAEAEWAMTTPAAELVAAEVAPVIVAVAPPPLDLSTQLTSGAAPVLPFESEPVFRPVVASERKPTMPPAFVQPEPKAVALSRLVDEQPEVSGLDTPVNGTAKRVPTPVVAGAVIAVGVAGGLMAWLLTPKPPVAPGPAPISPARAPRRRTSALAPR